MAADEFKNIRKALRSGEQPHRSARVRHHTNYGRLVLTSERVLFVQNSLFAFNVEEWPLDRIEAVSFKTGMVSGEIGVRTSGGQVSSFGEMNKKEVRIMADAIRAAVEAARGSKSADLADPSCGERTALFPVAPAERSVWTQVERLVSLPLNLGLATIRPDAGTTLELDAVFDELAQRVSTALASPLP
jgi:hypothetical protein